ncbi:Tol-Pal system beta propeller repeat protein TolB [Hyphomicrobium denitrificans ATCC 51888]|uniref:Tol-Pal system protein TolB n=1 Tax=Hyphomicrobium denitrificans (strain ATCC 51888 / DSM 1869 / NCIMB 11706 / TK 0415) TaxID=582899 RepID=D8JS02_HYPDA|nr:Tol-Pal system beta propeller repeat protein TolB [Hyphomicrobium denitrificans]ADJ24220.1 Tol-Pal system beta propeller repeat protein TolB [Hyphomicrobium denitrificans ATCC 51888]
MSPKNPLQYALAFICLIAVGLALDSGFATRAQAQLKGTQTEGTIAPIPIAIPLFVGDDPQLAANVSDVLQADLERSGLFRPLDRASFLEQIRDVNAVPRFGDWRSVQADALVVGRIVNAGDGRVGAEFRLWDVASGKQLAGQRFSTSAQNWRRIAHMIADSVYERLTGEKGYFDTRVVFVDETGPAQNRVKRLAIMDQDGANVRLLTQGKELVLTPRFSPTNQEITYMSYTSDQPKVFIMNLESGRRELVGDFPGMTFAPRFSPDGQRVVMSLGTPDGRSSIYEMDLRTRQPRRLTESSGIDTSPSYSPDGRQIVFESDRDGTQKLYVMNADGSGAHPISLGGGSYSTPVWSPRGDYIAFTQQAGGRFLIGVMKPDGSGERVLTEGFHNEGPTWAPNGRVLMFWRDSQSTSGGPKIYSVDITGFNERQVTTPSFASDPAWSPLLN